MPEKRLSRDQLTKFYRQMLIIRICEEAFIDPIRNKEILCPVHLSCGEEAVAVGICSALKEKDYIFGNHRSHGQYLAKGGDLKEMVAEVFCKESGCSRGRGGSMHLISPGCGVLGTAPIVAGTISLALGAALASWTRGSGEVSVSFFGDGATGEGVLCEALNFAALKKLPVVFVCLNNLYSTHLKIDEIRVSRKIFQMALPYGKISYRVDGNNVLKVYEKACKAVERCRNGEGPVFLECMTYRQRGHVGPDDCIQGIHTDIRPVEEVCSWIKKDPIQRFLNYLLTVERFKKEELLKIHDEVTVEVEEAFSFARGSGYPSMKELNRYVFAE